MGRLRMSRAAILCLVAVLVCSICSEVDARGNKKKKGHGGPDKKIGLGSGSVTYDSRSLIVNGKRELFFSGSFHYPRSTPDMWPGILQKAREGGLNLIQTYVFWNIHEPIQGQFNFSGNYDLVRFIKMIGEHGLYVTLRVGPFIEAEWNHGGFPYWLREVPGIIFRSDNPPFKYHMEKFVRMIVDMMRDNKLFAPQGGPIVLAQIENEYNSVQLAYRELGVSYVQWAGKLALSLNAGVPWVMCKQRDAPGPIINTCNGRHCGDTFTGPNHPGKPALWTENWTAQYRVFGDPPSQRSAEDLAFSVARWFAKNGTLTNYYMYHGGTNFGRTTSSFVTTRYYDEAPLDEFGLQREPKWGHLKDLHSALRLSRKALLWGNPHVQKINKDLEVIQFEKAGTDICAAFLTNNNSKTPATITFRGEEYFMPPHSISILPDCKTVVFNTLTIVSQHNSRNFVVSKAAQKNLKWEMYKEVIPTMDQTKVVNKTPLELYSLTKDTTDYAWYTTSMELDRFDLPMRSDVTPVLRVASLGHAIMAFVNGEFAGAAHGSNVEKNFVFQKPMKLKQGINHIAMLGILVGFPDSGAYMEHRYAGPRSVTVLGLNTGTLDLSLNNWGHQVSLDGELKRVFTDEGSKRVQWTPAQPNMPLTWYKAKFDAPEGREPVAINMTSMGKGMIWVNGNSLGRYWTSYHSPLGRPTQEEYHCPRAFIKPTGNLLVVLEEEGGDAAQIDILVVNRDTICSYITEFHPPNVKSWGRRNSKIKPVVDEVKSKAHLRCPSKKVIGKIEFASFGDPYGACGNYAMGNCSSPVSQQIVEQHCLGKEMCDVPIERGMFDKGGDQCPDISKTLAIQAKCSHDTKHKH
uniref:Beta-galactosidase n=1 Tax=Kalanchoe fedtschenkoi TaxID=63787 RepID=A0A7N0UZK8_KALFE